MKVAIASGKGGTGKTTVAVNLARLLDGSAQLLDCDVEAPNAHLFLRGTIEASHPITIPVPQIDTEQCTLCGACGAFCAYNAIVVIKPEPIVFPELCHGCGGCMKVCPENAISEVDKSIGVVESLTANGVPLTLGRLDVGVAMAPPLIRAVLDRRRPSLHTLIDAPPVTSCPVMAAVRKADYVVLVTEPTPFGLHDLKLAVAMIRSLGLPFGVVINRMGIGDNRVHRYCQGEGIPVLLEIPDDRRIAEAYSEGEILIDALPEYRTLFESLAHCVFNGELETLPTIGNGQRTGAYPC